MGRNRRHKKRSQNQTRDDQQAREIATALFSNPEPRDVVYRFPPGIKNEGATCYLNVILQCLAQTTAILYGIKFEDIGGLNSQVYESMMAKFGMAILDTLFNMSAIDSIIANDGDAYLWGDEECAYSLDVARFIYAKEVGDGLWGKGQQDAHEFLKEAVEAISIALSELRCKSGIDYVTTFFNTFQGRQCTRTTCSACGRTAKVEEPFSELSIPTKHFDDVSIALLNHLAEETLSGENSYFCENCNTHLEASRRIEFCQLPDVLIVQLKVFDQCRLSSHQTKLSKKLSIPSSLDMGAFLSDTFGDSRTEYHLYAVVIHIGDSIRCGHYVAYVMDSQSLEWFLCNDQSVRHVKHEAMREFLDSSRDSDETPYILFYSRV